MIDGIPLSDLTAPAVLLIAVLLVLLGWLVPKRILDDAIRQRDRAMALAEKTQQDNEVTHDLLRAIKNGGSDRAEES